MIVHFSKRLIVIALIAFVILMAINIYVVHTSKKMVYSSVNEVPSVYTGLVLGARVSESGAPSGFLQDRLDMAYELYRIGKVKRLLLSGDHGTKEYDEVNNMRNYLMDKGVDTRDVFLDHAGFDTYNSIVRAREIFGVTEMIIVSQEFHLSRALFIAEKKKVKAYGLMADKLNYGSLTFLKFREKIACAKAFWEVMINKDPRFLGEKIPISGDSRLSHDKFD